MAKKITRGSDLKDRQEIIEFHVKEILEALDEELKDDLLNTPNRVARMFMEEIYRGESSLTQELSKVFPEPTTMRELVVVKDVPFRGYCAHHLVPYFGTATVGYIPNKKLLGLSKVARLVWAAGRGLTIQEKVTQKIADALEQVLEPFGVAVVVDAVHTCMVVRGARATGSSTTTSAIRGIFRDGEAARAEFYSVIRKGS